MFKKMKTLLNQKAFLMGLLLLALGSSLSWNPEYFTIARHEYIQTESVELAQKAETGDTKKTFEIQKYSGTIDKGEVEYYITEMADKKSYKVNYIFTSDGINGKTQRIVKVGEVVLSNEVDKTTFVLKTELAKDIEKQLSENIKKDKASVGQATGTNVKEAREGRYIGRSGRNTSYRARGCGADAENGDVSVILSCRMKEMKKQTVSCMNGARKDAEKAKQEVIVEMKTERDELQAEIVKMEAEYLDASRTKGFDKTDLSMMKDDLKTAKADLTDIKNEIKNIKPDPDFTECKAEAKQFFNENIKQNMRFAARSFYGTDGFNAYLESVGELMGMPSIISRQLSDDAFNIGYKGLVRQTYDYCTGGGVDGGMGAIGAPGVEPSMYMNSLQYMSRNNQQVGCMKSLMSNLAPVVANDMQWQMMNTYDTGIGVKIGVSNFNSQTFVDSYWKNFTQPVKQFTASMYPNDGNAADFIRPYNVMDSSFPMSLSRPLGVGNSQMSAAEVEAYRRSFSNGSRGAGTVR